MSEDTQDEQAEDVEEKAGSKKKLIIVLVSVLLVVCGAGGYFAFVAMSDEAATAEDAVADADAESVGDEPALFAPLHPPLVINLKDALGQPHFLQITLEIMARDQAVVDEVKNHAAVIRNALILMYGTLDFDEVQTRAGKERMLADALAEIQDIIQTETGKTGVEAVYFTSLIVQ